MRICRKQRKIIYFICVFLLIFAVAYPIILMVNISSLSNEGKIQLVVYIVTSMSFLSYVLFTVWAQHIHIPELMILHDNNHPDLYSPQIMILYPNNRRRELRFLRVGIKNIGSKTATNCLGIVQLKRRPEGQHTLSTEPKIVFWPATDNLPSIPPDAIFYLNLGYSGNGEELEFEGGCDGYVRAWICTREAFNNPRIRAQDSLCLGEYKLVLNVHSDNSYSVTREVILNITRNWDEFNMRIE